MRIIILGGTEVSVCVVLYLFLLVVIGIIDMRTMIISNKMIMCMIVMSIPFFFIQPELAWWDRMLGSLVISVPMLLMTSMYAGAFGGGDIKLMAVSGLVLGIEKNLVAFGIGVFVAGGYMLMLLFMQNADRKSRIPFGPGLCIGCSFALIYGEQIVNWYLRG